MAAGVRTGELSAAELVADATCRRLRRLIQYCISWIR